MAPVIAIVGNSNSGKTMLLEKLIPELEGRGYRLVVVKHGHDVAIDQPGKDTWRMKQAGATAVVLSSAQELAFMKPMTHDASLEELVRFVGGDFDLILAEGYKQADVSKIEVHRSESGNELLCFPEELVAVVTDQKLAVSVPQFGTDEVKNLADLIERRFLTKKEEDVTLLINDRNVPLNPFVSEFMVKTLIGMVSALKDVGKVEKLNIWFKRKVKSSP